MPDPDELRGSTPVMTAKDVLLEVRSDVKGIAKNVDVLMSQNLDARLTALERSQMRGIGMAVGLSLAITLIGILLSISFAVMAMDIV